MSHGRSRPGRPLKVAFLFTGQGSQYVGMARGLYESEPKFREALDRCAAALEGHIDRPLADVIFAASSAPALLDQTAYTQPALFAVEYALAELWASWGVRPWAVLGHSVGEYVAACIAGVMTMEDGLRLVATRARLMQGLSESGVMLAVFTDRASVDAALSADRDEVSLAALNGPAHVVISGHRQAVGRIGERLRSQGVRTRELRVSHAFHSPLMTPILGDLRQAVRAVRLSRPGCLTVSNLTGAPVSDEITDPEYWVRHVMAPVDFAAGMAALGVRDVDLFLEIGPDPVLLAMGRECLGGPPERWLPSLQSNQPAGSTLLESLATLYARGVEIDWGAFYPGVSKPRVTLPNYPFQRRRYWLETTSARTVPDRVPPGERHEEGSSSPDLLYRVEWEPRPPAPAGPLGSLDGDWLILADRGGVGTAIADVLRGLGHRCLMARAGVGFRRLGGGNWELDPDDPGGFQRLLDATRGRGENPVSRVLFLWGLDAPATAWLDDSALKRWQSEGCAALLHLVHAATSIGGTRPRLWVVTRDAVEAGEGLIGAPAQAPLWGFARGVSLEHPELLCGCIDLDPTRSDGEAEAVVAEVLGGGRDDQTAFRGGMRHVPRLVAGCPAASAGFRVSDEWTYLITGGFGALGLAVARFLADSGARRLVLVGRRGAATEMAREAVTRLRGAGVEVRCEALDVADRRGMEALFASLRVAGVAPRGIVHAAGLPGYSDVRAIDAEALEAVLRPKILGACLLHDLSLGTPLDFFVMFSSIASVWGSRAQAHYAAANRFLDALAHHRRGLGLPALSVNWGPWSGGGMTSSEAEALLRLAGVNPLPVSAAIDALARLLGGKVTQAVVADIDWARFKGSYEARGERPLLERFTVGKPGVTPTVRRPGFMDELRKVAPGNREILVMQLVRSEAAQVLALGEAWHDPEQAFFETGMDSLLAIEFRSRLEATLGRALPVTLVFDHPTPRDLADFLLKLVENEVAVAGAAGSPGGGDASAPWSTASNGSPTWRPRHSC
jgi:acyl transferase domain-containing protein